MDKIIELPEVDEFFAGPLVTWLSSCLELIIDEKLTYDSLVNGYFIHNVFLEMKLKVHDDDVCPLDTPASRSRNLLAVLNNIRHFYEDCLGQVIIQRPDVESLAREPEHHVREIELLLVLLLGCAVQCPKKQDFIKRITSLDETNKMDLADYISQVMNVPGIVLSKEMFDDPTNADKAMDCVRRICDERDKYEAQIHRRQEIEERPNFDDDMYSENLRFFKYKIADLEEQMRHKEDELEDAREELKEAERKLCEITTLHKALVLDAKNTNYYRDELDAALETAEKAEQQIVRLKKKLAELDSCQARLKEFEKINKALTESKAKLIEQAKSQRAEKEKMKDLRRQVTKLTERMSNLSAENEENRDKYLKVCQERTELQRLIDVSYKQLHVHQRSSGIPSLQDDLLLDQAKSQIAKLQAEKENLIEKLNQTLFETAKLTPKITMLTQDNKNLLQKIEQLQDKRNNLGLICKQVMNEATKLQQQELENLKSQLKNAQECSTRGSTSSDKSASKNPTNISVDVPKVTVQQTKKFAFKTRSSIKYPKNQSRV